MSVPQIMEDVLRLVLTQLAVLSVAVALDGSLTTINKLAKVGKPIYMYIDGHDHISDNFFNIHIIPSCSGFIVIMHFTFNRCR